MDDLSNEQAVKRVRPPERAPGARAGVGSGRRAVAGALVAALLPGGAVAFTGAATASASTAGFSATGTLATARSHAAIVRLSSGQVLLAGGEDSSGTPLASAELFNPTTGSWSATGPMPRAATRAAATLLSNGDVLVAGGLTGPAGAIVASSYSEIYRPSTGTWSSTTAPLQIASSSASAARLGNGSVLYAGGYTSSSSSATATDVSEIYDPATGTWSTAGTLPVGVALAAMSELADGTVLLAGGETASSGTLSTLAEVYQPASGTWTALHRLPVAVAAASTVLLANGDVLVAGGTTAVSAAPAPTTTTQLFDPSTGSWSVVGALSTASFAASAVLLGSGQVLYAGGMVASSSPTGAASLFDPSTGRWTTTGSLAVARGYASAVRLASGDVLLTGGITSPTTATAESELYGAGAAPVITSAANLTVPAGVYSSFTITATGSPAPAFSLAGSLPPGLSLRDNGNGTATVSGAPASYVGGTYGVTITATNALGTAVQHLSILLSAPAAPVITSASTFVAHAGTYNAFTVTTSAWPAPVIQLYGTLPTGLSFHDNANGTATISGTPPSTTGGEHAVTLTASNGVSSAAVQHLVISFARTATITSADNLSVRDGVFVSFEVASSGVPSARLSIAGALPEGLSFQDNSDGTATISGTPRVSLDQSFVVVVSADNGIGGVATLTLRISASAAVPPSSPFGVGYWYATSSGSVIAKGAVNQLAPVSPQHPRDVVAMAATPRRSGYYLLSRSGGVFNYGDADWYGSIAARHLATPTVAIAVTPSGKGYYLVTRAGNVFCFGDARFYGSTARTGLPPIATIALMPDARGYWLVTARGNVYGFGAARFYGSPARQQIAQVVAFASAPDGHGYWVVTVTGNVLNYGSARHYGSMVGRRVPAVSAFAPTADGTGYWLVTRAGNVYNLGSARFFGSSANTLAGAVTAFAPAF